MLWYQYIDSHFNTLRPRQNGRHFADAIFKCIFFNENAWISLEISLNFVPKVQISNIPALVQIMAWRWPGDKPLSEPMMVNLLTHICVTWPQWVKDEKAMKLSCLYNGNPYSGKMTSLYRYQAITLTNVKLSVKSNAIHLRAISQEIPQPSVIKISMEITPKT